jgi:hypothetical protein
MGIGVILLILVMAPALQAEIVNQLLPVADTALRDSEPDKNFGSAQNLPVGVSGNGNPTNRVLYRFDLTWIPADAVFNSVKLLVPVTQAGPSSPQTGFDLRRVLVGWTEGNKPGLAATFGEATWNDRSKQEFAWGSGGGHVGTDYASSVSGSATLAGAGSITEYSSAGITADVYLWKTNAGTNFGWVLMAQGEPPGTGKQVGAREHPTTRPILELRYSSYSIYDIQRIGGALRFSFDVSSNQTYSVEFRDSANAGPWTTLTNIPAFATDRTIHITNQLTSTPRFYRLRKP